MQGNNVGKISGYVTGTSSYGYEVYDLKLIEVGKEHRNFGRFQLTTHRFLKISFFGGLVFEFLSVDRRAFFRAEQEYSSSSIDPSMSRALHHFVFFFVRAHRIGMVLQAPCTAL